MKQTFSISILSMYILNQITLSTLLLTLLYFLPTILNYNKKTFLINALTAWTVIGWFISMIDSLSSNEVTPSYKQSNRKLLIQSLKYQTYM